jgi:hypothetical protein
MGGTSTGGNDSHFSNSGLFLSGGILRMKLIVVIAGMLLCASSLMAETYSWIDENGTMNFTEDYSNVPKKYRKKVHIRGNDDGKAAPVQQPPLDSATNKNMDGRSAEQEKPKTIAPEKIYGDKSLEIWENELKSAQAETVRLDVRVKGLAVEVKSPELYNVSHEQIVARANYNEAVEAYNKSLARYEALLKSAISAGVIPPDFIKAR